jgi:hypothetical protein
VAIPYRRFLCRRGRDIKPQPGAARARLLHIRRPRRQIFGFGDVVPMFNVRWNDGVNNFMAYVERVVHLGDLAGCADRGAEEADARQVIQGSTILLRMA